MAMDGSNMWMVLIPVIAVVGLAAALIYGRIQASKTTPAQDAARDAATRDEYEHPDPETATPDPGERDPDFPPRL